MAARVQQLLSRTKALADPAVKTLRSEAVKRYEGVMAANAEFVVRDKQAADKLLRQWVFTQLSRIPSGIVHSQEEAAVLRHKLANFKDLPVPEMGRYLGFAAELYAWFAIGEIVGRGGSLTGYAV